MAPTEKPCRDRKIRCGREKPQCVNCERDEVECLYVNQGKRVNHVKLLCSNVESMDDRLRHIESGLSKLANILSTNGDNYESRGTTSDQYNLHLRLQNESPAPTDRHILRSQDDLLDRYYGPCTLFSMSNDLRQNAKLQERIHNSDSEGSQFSEMPSPHGSSSKAEVEDLLRKLCQEAVGTTSSAQEVSFPVRLPPRQFVSMVQSQFFDQDDYRTNIFVQSSFSSNVDRLYRDVRAPYSPSDEAWAVCFNIIILLVLGTDGSCRTDDSSEDSQFTIPFRRTFDSAITNLSSLIQPKLINVQTLALLSLAAQKYHPSSISDSIFMQACMLAKRMGLHQMHRKSSEPLLEEAEERHMVFRSLYLRDKSLMISHGSICWLPTFDSNLSLTCNEIDASTTNDSARLSLASIQEDVYRSFRSADATYHSKDTSQKSQTRIRCSLEHWAATHDDQLQNSLNSRGKTALHLDFLTTRISASYASQSSATKQQAIEDSRACCQMVLESEKQAPKVTSKTISPQNATSRPQDSSRKGSVSTQFELFPRSSSLQIHSALDTLPAIALFVLTTHILESDEDNESWAEGDFGLLQKVSACYKDVHAKTQANNQTRQLGRTLELLLSIVSHSKFNWSSGASASSEFSSSLPGDFFEPNQDIHNFDSEFLHDYTFTPMMPPFEGSLPPSWNCPPMQNQGSARGSLDNSTGLLSPLNMDFLNGVFDSDQHQMMMPIPPLESRKRTRLSEPEIYGSAYQ